MTESDTLSSPLTCSIRSLVTLGLIITGHVTPRNMSSYCIQCDSLQHFFHMVSIIPQHVCSAAAGLCFS